MGSTLSTRTNWHSESTMPAPLMHCSSDTPVSAIVVSSLGICVVLVSFTLYSVFIFFGFHGLYWNYVAIYLDLLCGDFTDYVIFYRCFSIPAIYVIK